MALIYAWLMQLTHCTWPEVESRLENEEGILLPTGSTEQHGPMGLIGTDAMCAESIALEAGRRMDTLVAPVLAYTPAPFNMAFAGTISVSPETFEALFADVVGSLAAHDIRTIYVLNGHGAKLAPMKSVAEQFGTRVRIRSWWDFDPVNALRSKQFGDWEGMHATPSEVAITQAKFRTVSPGTAAEPPEKLSREFILAHAGDRHGPPDEHRAMFPDGRVGSHSALATPELGEALFEAAVEAVIEDYTLYSAR